MSFVPASRFWLVLLVTALALIGLLFIPTPYHQVMSLGTDSYETHHRLYGDRHQSQVIALRHDIRGAGALLVNLRPTTVASPVVVTAWSIAGEKLATATITDQLADDTFAWVAFDQTISAAYGPIRLEFSAPTATARNPIGLRFDASSPEQLAVGIIERISVWQQWGYWQDAHPVAAARLQQSLAGGMVGLLALYFFPQSRSPRGRLAWYLGLLALVVVAVTIRVPLLKSIESVYGGDAYNYIFKSYAWIKGEDPFAADVRKAPLYSFLLLPGLTTDPILWGRIINIVAASLAVLLLPMLLRRLHVPPALALGGGLLLAVNRDFRWESVHGLANVLYATLIVGAAVALTHSQRARAAYVVGVLSGAITLTRYEGGLVGVVMLPAVWLYHRLRPSWIIYTLLPACVLVLLPFVLWPLTGNLGVRPPADIVADGGLSVAYSLDDFAVNLKTFKQIFGRVWLFTPGTGNQFGAFIVGTVIGVILETLAKVLPGRASRWRKFGIVLPVLWLLLILVRDTGPVAEHIVLLLTALTGFGMVALLARQPRYAVPLLLVVLLQIMVVTAILPKPRYYLQVLPFLSMALIGAIASLSLWTARLSRAGALFFLGAIIALVYFDGNDALGGFVSDYNSRSQANTVMLRAARHLRDHPGAVAMSTDDLSMRIVLGDQRVARFVMTDNKPPTVAAQLTWLQERQLPWLVESTVNPLFTILDEHPDYFEHMATFTTRYGPARAEVWRVQLP